jgi:hypothetical protein
MSEPAPIGCCAPLAAPRLGESEVEAAVRLARVADLEGGCR